MMFSFLPKKCAFYLKKIYFCVCFLKMFRPLKGCHVLFYIIRPCQWWKVLPFIPCKADDSCLFIGLPDLQKYAGYRYPILKLIFSLFCGVSLRKYYIIKATWSVM